MVELYVNLIRHKKWTLEKVPYIWYDDVKRRCIEEGLIDPDPVVIDEDDEQNGKDLVSEKDNASEKDEEGLGKDEEPHN